MVHSEPGKRIGHVSVCFDGKLVVWGGYNVSAHVRLSLF